MTDEATEGVNAIDVLQQLNAAAIALDKAANHLLELTRQYEGAVDENGIYQPGPQLRWEEAISDALDALVTEYETAEKRAPAVAVLERRAEKRAKVKDPDLWADYHRLRSEVAAIQKWISAKKETISARQSILKAEGTLAGAPASWPRQAAA